MTRVIAVDSSMPDPAAIRDAAAVLRSGGLVAFPTETVYGLGADALSATAVARLFAAKGRPPTDPVIVHLSSAEQLDRIARAVPDAARTLAAALWPGPLTLILPKATAIPDAVTAGLSTVAVRVPSHPIARALLAEAGMAVAAPSANRFSRPSPTRPEHVLEDLAGSIDLLIDGGPTTIGVESTIVDVTASPPLVRRPGGITLDALRSLVPEVHSVVTVAASDRAQLAPGQLLRHYAPRARLVLYIGATDALASRVSRDVRTAIAAGERVGVLAPEEDLMALAPRLAPVGGGGRVVTMRCGSRADRDEAARELFRALRALDAEGVDAIYATAPDGGGIDAAIIDRLTRAAEGRVVAVDAANRALD
jgi:L-threonylcarbamoyladenylate synthase